MTGIKSLGGPDGTWKKLEPNWNFGKNQKFLQKIGKSRIFAEKFVEV